MTKAEQEWSLIEALDYCKKKRPFNKSCAGCPYAGLGYGIDAAIEKLKAQEPVAPIEHYIPDEAHMRKTLAWECGNCLIDIGYGVNYCYNCGRPVKWE